MFTSFFIACFTPNQLSPQDNIFATGTQVNFCLIDPALESNSNHSSELLLTAESNLLTLALRERRSGRLLALEAISRTPGNDHGSLLETAVTKSEILKNHEFVNVRIATVSADYTLVPESLFRNGDEQKYFQLNFSNHENRILKSVADTFHDLVTVFAVPQEEELLFNKLFQSPVIVHHTSAILAALASRMQQNSGPRLWLHVRNNELDIAVWENKKLLLLNSFAWNTNDDVLYYTLFICEQLGLNPAEIPVAYSGDIENGSLLQILLSRYIADFSPAARPSAVNSVFSSCAPYYRHALIYNLLLCE